MSNVKSLTTAQLYDIIDSRDRQIKQLKDDLHALVRAAEWMKQTVNVFNLSNNALRDYREHAATIAQWAERMPK